jgi:hypothetical protein
MIKNKQQLYKFLKDHNYTIEMVNDFNSKVLASIEFAKNKSINISLDKKTNKVTFSTSGKKIKADDMKEFEKEFNNQLKNYKVKESNIIERMKDFLKD